MGAVTLIARLVLAGVFLIAAAAKLGDHSGSRKALLEFGVPKRLAGLLAVLLLIAELGVAIALLPATSAWFGALGALGLLALFILGISANLARGRTPDCHCFGQIHSEPIGLSTLARNGALAAIAGLVVAQGQSNPGPSVFAWVADLTLAQWIVLTAAAVGLALLAFAAWLLVQMLRQQGRILLRLDALEASVKGAPADGGAGAQQAPTAAPAGLAVGTPAPNFRLNGLRGEILTLDALRAGDKPVLLHFAHPHCGPCQALVPDIGRWQREYAARLNVAVISEGKADDNRGMSAEHGLTQVLLQEKREVAEAFQAYGTPAAVVVRPDGAIGSSLALGVDAIRELVARTLGLPVAVPEPALLGNGSGHNGRANAILPVAAPIKQGQLPPPLTFKDLDGKSVTLSSFRGTRTMLLFWNPGCGFCQAMLEHLKAWEAHPPSGAPKLLVISTGTGEANRGMGLRSPVVLDEGFKAGNTFGASGTPMAVLLDAEGRVAAEVAAGASAVFQLAGGAPVMS